MFKKLANYILNFFQDEKQKSEPIRASMQSLWSYLVDHKENLFNSENLEIFNESFNKLNDSREEIRKFKGESENIILESDKEVDLIVKDEKAKPTGYIFDLGDRKYLRDSSIELQGFAAKGATKISLKCSLISLELRLVEFWVQSLGQGVALIEPGYKDFAVVNDLIAKIFSETNCLLESKSLDDLSFGEEYAVDNAISFFSYANLENQVIILKKIRDPLLIG